MLRTLLQFLRIAIVILPASIAVGEVVEADSAPSRTEKVIVTANRAALLSITISSDATEEVKAAAVELAEGLEKITGVPFAVTPGSEARGIVLGTSDEWPGILEPVDQEREAIYARDDYRLLSAPGALYLVGRSPTGVSHAVWGFFHHLGFRQFFPGPRWEIWPQQADLSIQVDQYARPDYVFRELTMLEWQENRAGIAEWKRRNRMTSGFWLRTGHAYNAIVKRNAAFFREHPAALTEKVKFDPAYPGLKEMLISDALSSLKRHPDSVSMDPSDHGGWLRDSSLGSPSNQAITLANEVAEGIAVRYPESKVGIYAYNEHAPPPEIGVHPNVVVSIATAFIKGGFTVDELIEGWKAKGATIGIRDYMNVWPWHRDHPGRARASDLDYLFHTIPYYHGKGARFWRSETTPSWAVNGLGQYLVSQLLWDVSLVKDRERLLADFYLRAFGEAAEPMKRYFEECLLAQARAPISQDLLGRMYRHLEAALEKTSLQEERARIYDFAIYTRFLEIGFSVKGQGRSERQRLLSELGIFSYRARHTGMLSSRLQLREFRKKNDVIDPIGALAPAEEHPLKQNDEPILEDELNTYISEGVARYPLLDFVPRAFEGALMPALHPSGGGQSGEEPQPVVVVGHSRFYVYTDTPGQAIRFQVQVISKRGNRGPARLELFSAEEDEGESAFDTAEAPADHQRHETILIAPAKGCYRVEITAPGNTEISWPAGQRVGIPQENVNLAKAIRQSFYFYVPEGTQSLGGYSANSSGSILGPNGTAVYRFQNQRKPTHFSIPVSKEQTGKWWRLSEVVGEKSLLTVPRILARIPEEGLVPQDAMQKERRP